MKRVDAVAKSNLSLPAKWLAVFMAHHENRNGQVTATLSEMRVWTSLGTRTLYEAIRDLQDAGFISVITPFQHVANSSAKFALSWGSAATAEPVRRQPQNLVSENDQTPDLDTRCIGVNELSDIPFPLNNPLSTPVSSSSSVSSFLPVLENEELGQEGISITRAAQPELIPTELPDWYLRLQRLPIIVTRPFTPTDIADVQRDFHAVDLSIQASAFVAYWTNNRRTLKVPLLAWRNWLRKVSRDDAAKQNGDHNGRYPRRRNLGPAVIPDDPSYYDPGSKLSAFRPR